MKVFDLAFTSADGARTTHLLFLIKAGYSFVARSALHNESQAIALFNANKHEEAMLRVQELVSDFPDTDPLADRIVEVSIKSSFVCRY